MAFESSHAPFSLHVLNICNNFGALNLQKGRITKKIKKKKKKTKMAMSSLYATAPAAAAAMGLYFFGKNVSTSQVFYTLLFLTKSRRSIILYISHVI